MAKDKQIQKSEETNVPVQTPERPSLNIEALIAEALKSGNVDTVKDLLAIRKEMKDEWSKEQYDRAMAAFQSECPTIEKTKGVKTNSGSLAYKYAPLESIINQVKPILQKHGFSYSSDMEIVENGTIKIKVTITVKHAAGHSESKSMIVPLGTKTGIMSDTQVYAAAQTFAKRYAFCNAFGILTGDEDNEAALKGQKEAKAIADEYIKKINKAKTLNDLAAVAKSLTGKIKPEFQQSLRDEYARRKEEIENQEVEAMNEEADKAIRNK